MKCRAAAACYLLMLEISMTMLLAGCHTYMGTIEVGRPAVGGIGKNATEPLSSVELNTIKEIAEHVAVSYKMKSIPIGGAIGSLNIESRSSYVLLNAYERYENPFLGDQINIKMFVEVSKDRSVVRIIIRNYIDWMENNLTSSMKEMLLKELKGSGRQYRLVYRKERVEAVFFH